MVKHNKILVLIHTTLIILLKLSHNKILILIRDENLKGFQMKTIRFYFIRKQ